MAIPTPRVSVPERAAKDELFRVRTVISHEMETGLRRDREGVTIPRHIIKRFACRYGGIEVFSVELHEAMSANPFIEFYLYATESGRLEFVWEEDGGGAFYLAHELLVS